jgi:hypothetical protein
MSFRFATTRHENVPPTTVAAFPLAFNVAASASIANPVVVRLATCSALFSPCSVMKTW